MPGMLLSRDCAMRSRKRGLKAYRNAVFGKKMLCLRDGVLAEVEDARGQNCICFPAREPIQEMFQGARSTARNDRDPEGRADCGG